MPAKLPFEVKKEVKAPAEKKVVASVESSWNIQIGAYPKKEEARLKLKEIRASGYKFLSGKQAITVEVQKGSQDGLPGKVLGLYAENRQGGLRPAFQKRPDLPGLFASVLKQDILGLIDFGGEIIGAAAIRMKVLHQAAMGILDVLAGGPCLKPQHGQRLIA